MLQWPVFHRPTKSKRIQRARKFGVAVCATTRLGTHSERKQNSGNIIGQVAVEVRDDGVEDGRCLGCLGLVRYWALDYARR